MTKIIFLLNGTPITPPANYQQEIYVQYSMRPDHREIPFEDSAYCDHIEKTEDEYLKLSKDSTIKLSINAPNIHCFTSLFLRKQREGYIPIGNSFLKFENIYYFEYCRSIDPHLIIKIQFNQF